MKPVSVFQLPHWQASGPKNLGCLN